MSKWKAVAVFFTLLLFSSLRGTLYVYFSMTKEGAGYRTSMMTLAILLNLLFLFFAVRYWKKAFSADKNRPDKLL